MQDYESYIINPLIEQYIGSLYNHNDPILKEMEALAKELDFPIIGPQAGKFLYQITKISGARKIFELGSGFGYSAYWFAKAIGKNGNIICTDKSGDNFKMAMDFFDKGLQGVKIEYVVGESLEILKDQRDKFDIILNDIDKEQYPEVIELAEEKLIKGGILITDNVLWFGRVISDDKSISTSGVKKFNETIGYNKSFITSILPLRDGIAISLKI